MPRPARARRDWIWLNVAFIGGLPVVAAVAVPWYFATRGLSWSPLLAAGALWWVTGLGITAGYHRLFSHQGWSAPTWVRALAAFCGGGAAQNSVIAWSAAHRYHHAEVDTAGDPYNIHEGFWHAHVLWVVQRGAHHDDFDNVPDLQRDPVCAFQHRHYLALTAAFNVGIPLALGLLAGDVLGMLIVAGVLRIVVVQHFTFLINSAAHTWGTRRFSQTVTARDNWFLSLFTFGEGYHNFHHAFQADYRNGIAWFSYDPTKWLIWCMSRLGLARNLQRTPVDVIWRLRFESVRSTYADRLAGWEAEMRERMLAAERALDEELGRLRDARRAWARRREELKLAARAEMVQARAEMERALADARAAVRRAMRRWDALVAEVG